MKTQKMRQTFHGFNSQRQQTTHSLQARNNSKSASRLDSLTLHLHFPIFHETQKLLVQFKNQLKYNEYKCIQVGQRQLLLIRLSLYDRFKKLFMCKHPPKFLITLTTHQFLSIREAVIRPLKSISLVSSQQIDAFQLQNHVQSIGNILKQVGIRLGQRPQGQNQSQYVQDCYSYDATSYYMLSRMLVNSNYGIGKKIRFCRQGSHQPSRQDLRYLSASLNEITRDLLQGFNCSRQQFLQILNYCRKSTQQYFFSRQTQKLANNSIKQEKYSQKFNNQCKQLSKIIPMTLTQLLRLQQQNVSMQILKRVFMVSLMFRAQKQNKPFSQQTTSRCLQLIKICFSDTFALKSKILKCSGYPPEVFQQYLNKFEYDHQVTFE